MNTHAYQLDPRAWEKLWSRGQGKEFDGLSCIQVNETMVAREGFYPTRPSSPSKDKALCGILDDVKTTGYWRKPNG